MTRFWHWQLDHPVLALLPLPVVGLIIGLVVTRSIPRNSDTLSVYLFCVLGYTLGMARVLHIQRRQRDCQRLA